MDASSNTETYLQIDDAKQNTETHYVTNSKTPVVKTADDVCFGICLVWILILLSMTISIVAYTIMRNVSKNTQ